MLYISYSILYCSFSISNYKVTLSQHVSLACVMSRVNCVLCASTLSCGSRVVSLVSIETPFLLQYNSRMAKTTHAVVESYSELFEEVEVEHINSVWPVFLDKQLNLVAIT